ncbi:hypothetical protein HPB48_019354 [Haemaphysalis longicornis]|uniref:DDE-1 domain-containing protein n=1 Tax=Haemaphysalis longicornis TaxID=44386 RepID=A0A9J6G544_HAELO|nr:hypothetical protein HPB48_019354 [Haemaphysalis longicornis]
MQHVELHQERLRRQRVRRKQESEENEKHIAAIESKINACRQQILDKANQERQEEEMKEEVDFILSEIRFKINRTRDYLEKLKALKQLRAARKESYQQKGLYVAPEADESFEKGMASVESLLEGQLSDYLKEETALKVMLEVEQKEQYESSKLENKQKAVLRSLFGDTENTESSKEGAADDAPRPISTLPLRHRLFGGRTSLDRSRGAPSKRHVCLLMDNCSANQTTCELDNIELKFLPLNTTARLQPLERHSRLLMNLRVSTELKVDQLGAIHMMTGAWNSVKQSVANCFRKAGFVTAEHSEACEDGDDDE